MSKERFEAEILAGRGGGAYVEFPFDVEKVYGTRGRVKVRATFDGEPYRGSIAPMGGGVHVLGITKAIRDAIDKSVGDSVVVVVEPDSEPRIVELPEDLAEALAENPAARKFFDGLAYTYRKDYARWIGGAKKTETRQRRLKQAIEKLTRGERLS